MKRLKKIMISMGVSILIMWTKVLAMSGEILSGQVLYGVMEPMYGVARGPRAFDIFAIIAKILIPIAFLVGIIAYIKKSRSNTTIKLIVSILLALVLGFIYYLLFVILSNI